MGSVPEIKIDWLVVMGDSAKKKPIRFDSLLCQNLPRQSTPEVLDSGLKLLDQSTEAITGCPYYNRAAIIAFAEASSDIAANANYDAILWWPTSDILPPKLFTPLSLHFHSTPAPL